MLWTHNLEGRKEEERKEGKESGKMAIPGHSNTSVLSANTLEELVATV